MNNEKIISKLKEDIENYENIKKSVSKSIWKNSEDSITLIKLKAELKGFQEAQKQSAEEIKVWKDRFNRMYLTSRDIEQERDNLKQQLSNVDKIIDGARGLPPSTRGNVLDWIQQRLNSISKGDVHSQGENNKAIGSEPRASSLSLSGGEPRGESSLCDTPLGKADDFSCIDFSSAPKDNDICERVNSVGFKGQCRKCISCGDVKIWDYPNTRKCPNGKNHKWRPVSSDSLNEEENKSIKEQIELDKKVKHKVINFVASKDERSEE